MKGIIVILAGLFALTAFAFWTVPILWAHGSSAAFNAASFIVTITVCLWGGLVYLLIPRRK